MYICAYKYVYFTVHSQSSSTYVGPLMVDAVLYMKWSEISDFSDLMISQWPNEVIVNDEDVTLSKNLALCLEMMNENAKWIWEEEVLHILRDGSQPNTAQSREERVSVKGRGSSWWQTGSWRHLSLACREQLPQISFVRWWVSSWQLKV